MAAADNAITIKDDMSMDLPLLPANQGVEALKDIVFGSAAGMAGKLIEYPFDTVKVRLQSQPDHLPLRYAGPLDCLRQSFQTEGVRGLYRGISAPMAGAAVETSSLFFSYRILQEAMKATVCSSTEPLPLSALLVCGALSGSFTSLLLTPIELIKCKMQVPADAPGRRPPGIVSLIASVFRHQGLLGFWRGQLGTLIRETGGSAAWFGSYEGMSALFRKYSKHPPGPATATGSAKEAQLPLYQQMTAGAVAGVSYNFVFYPADTIKSRMQTEDVVRSAGKSERLTFWGVGQSLWKQQGLKGLYRGCGITVCRSAPSSAFIFSIYEGLRQYFG